MRGLFDDGLGAKCNAQTGDAQHRQIVGAVAHRDDLFERNIVLSSAICAQQLGLARDRRQLSRLDLAGDHPIARMSSSLA